MLGSTGDDIALPRHGAGTLASLDVGTLPELKPYYGLSVVV